MTHLALISAGLAIVFYWLQLPDKLPAANEPAKVTTRKKAFFNMGLVLFSILTVFCFFLTSCTSKNDFATGKKQLEQQGYTDIKTTGHKWFCCSQDENYSTGFECKDKSGNIVKGCFCSDLGKGVTIRFK